MAADPDRPLEGIVVAARYANCSREHLRREAVDGRIRAYKVGRDWRFDLEELREDLRARPVPEPAAPTPEPEFDKIS